MQKITQIFPVLMISMYIVLYTLTYFNFYNQELFDFISNYIDTPLLILTFIGAIFYIKKWGILSVISFIYVILLNILTEAGIRFAINSYHVIYFWTIVVGFITMIIFTFNRRKNA